MSDGTPNPYIWYIFVVMATNYDITEYADVGKTLDDIAFPFLLDL